VAKQISKAVYAAIAGAAFAVTSTLMAGVTPAYAHHAQMSGDPIISTQNRTVRGERYIPGIWVDPDGCEHWVMDDGVEGYMTPHVTRQGIPVCRRGNVCGVMNTDQFFATDKYHITQHGQQRLREFFAGANASAYIIAGHTDSRASDEYNMRLSMNRANSVARVAQSTGARVVDVRGYGERLPAATNHTATGMAKNRRVEIICIR